MTDHELMNEIRDRDHAEFEEVCRQEQAEADAEAAYHRLLTRTDRLICPGPSTQEEIIGSLRTTQRYHHNTISMMIRDNKALFDRLSSELHLLRQQVRELQAWKDSTHAFLVEPALRDEEEEWKASMREGMV
jgi:hypothetical protein